MQQKNKFLLLSIYILATIQFTWCYLCITRPYVTTLLYENGQERMPFQGRLLMAQPLHWAHQSNLLQHLVQLFALSHFWFPRAVQPEVLVQATVNVLSLLVAGLCTTRIYQAASRNRLLTPVVYPLLLVVCGVTYILHTVQNFRFVYDLPSLAFFSLAMYLIYLRKSWLWFAALFVVATINRETTLLLLPLYLINQAVEERRFQPKLLLRPRSLIFVLVLGLCWTAWEIFLHHHFARNASEFYPRINWNVKSILVPQAWPQLLSACGYLILLIVALRRRIPDPQLRAWLWILPIWLAFMFTFGILIETRVFGELIPFVVCASALICEELVIARLFIANADGTDRRPPSTSQAFVETKAA